MYDIRNLAPPHSDAPVGAAGEVSARAPLVRYEPAMLKHKSMSDVAGLTYELASCRFGGVEVRLYPRLLGGSQGVPKDGYAPLGLDWNEAWDENNVQKYPCTDTHKKACPKPRGELTETQRQVYTSIGR